MHFWAKIIKLTELILTKKVQMTCFSKNTMNLKTKHFLIFKYFVYRKPLKQTDIIKM